MSINYVGVVDFVFVEVFFVIELCWKIVMFFIFWLFDWELLGGVCIKVCWVIERGLSELMIISFFCVVNIVVFLIDDLLWNVGEGVFCKLFGIGC